MIPYNIEGEIISYESMPPYQDLETEFKFAKELINCHPKKLYDLLKFLDEEELTYTIKNDLIEVYMIRTHSSYFKLHPYLFENKFNFSIVPNGRTSECKVFINFKEGVIIV